MNIEYTTIKEMVISLESIINSKVIDGWKENKWYVLVVAGLYNAVRVKLRIPVK